MHTFTFSNLGCECNTLNGYGWTLFNTLQSNKITRSICSAVWFDVLNSAGSKARLDKRYTFLCHWIFVPLCHWKCLSILIYFHDFYEALICSMIFQYFVFARKIDLSQWLFCCTNVHQKREAFERKKTHLTLFCHLWIAYSTQQAYFHHKSVRAFWDWNSIRCVSYWEIHARFTRTEYLKEHGESQLNTRFTVLILRFMRLFITGLWIRIKL